jgi:hypothetical protein
VLSKKSRLAAGVAAAGACVLLAACAPLKMGAAAVVGNQRITSATLDSDVSSLQQALNADGGSQIPADEQPQAVLTWLIRFAIRDKVATENGITVNQTQIDEALGEIQEELEEGAEENGTTFNGLDASLADLGLPPTPNLRNALGQWEAQELAYIEKRNGGKLPTTQSGATTAENEVNKADCQAADALHIQVNPQYGELDYDTSSDLYGVQAPPNLLSAPSGAKAASSSPSLPKC